MYKKYLKGYLCPLPILSRDYYTTRGITYLVLIINPGISYSGLANQSDNYILELFSVILDTKRPLRD